MKKYLLAVGVSALTNASLFAVGESFGVEAFYGIAQKDLMESGGEKIKETDIFGVSLRLTKPFSKGIVLPKGEFLSETTVIVPEFFGMLSIGKGAEDVSYTEITSTYNHREKLDMEILTASLIGGADLRWGITDNFSISGGVRFGINYTNLNAEYSVSGGNGNYSDGKYSFGDNDIGFVYGLGIGAEYKFGDRHALTAGLDYSVVGSRPKVHAGTEDRKMKKQSYAIISVGYRYSF